MIRSGRSQQGPALTLSSAQRNQIQFGARLVDGDVCCNVLEMDYVATIERFALAGQIYLARFHVVDEPWAPLIGTAESKHGDERIHKTDKCSNNWQSEFRDVIAGQFRL